jgi:uncharacterized phage protein (TIGR01671 family)
MRAWDGEKYWHQTGMHQFQVIGGGYEWNYAHDLDDEFSSLVWEQCTGLKDKSGKLIYEGDIISYVDKTTGEAIYFRSVIFKGCFVLEESDDCDMPLDGIASDENHDGSHVCFIVGNVNENPELLNDR